MRFFFFNLESILGYPTFTLLACYIVQRQEGNVQGTETIILAVICPQFCPEKYPLSSWVWPSDLASEAPVTSYGCTRAWGFGVRLQAVLAGPPSPSSRVTFLMGMRAQDTACQSIRVFLKYSTFLTINSCILSNWNNKLNPKILNAKGAKYLSKKK